MLSQVRRTALTPLWIAQLATGAKSFERNLVIGSRRLNEWGLHAARVKLAHRLANSRRQKLAGRIAAQDREAFDRDGFVVRPNFLPAEQFAALVAPGQGVSWSAAGDLGRRHGHAQDRARPEGACPAPGTAWGTAVTGLAGTHPLCRQPRCRACRLGAEHPAPCLPRTHRSADDTARRHFSPDCKGLAVS